MQSVDVLVVDDAVDVRDGIVLVLQCHGYQVAEAGNGQEAMDWLAAHPRPRLILLDLYMPVMTGEQFCAERRTHEDWSTIPVVAISAAGGRARALAAGACDFLSKPFDVPALLNVVAHHL